MAQEKYYVVEARLPIEVGKATTPELAALKFAKIFQNRYGFDIDNWFLRIFEYQTDINDVGPNEYFSNPSGSKFRLITSNIEDHQEKYEKEVDMSQTPEDDR